MKLIRKVVQSTNKKNLVNQDSHCSQLDIPIIFIDS